MDLEDIYENVERRDIQNTSGRKTQSHGQDEGKDLKRSKQNISVLLKVYYHLIIFINFFKMFLFAIFVVALPRDIKIYL